MALRLRRGTNAERLGITPAEGELIYTTDTQILFVGNGNTAGGIAVGTPEIFYGVNTAGHILPTANMAYDIGSSTLRFRDLYLSGNTIDLGGSSLEANANGGYISFVPAPIASNQNPKALIVSSSGYVFTVNTTNGVLSTGDVASAISSNSGINLFNPPVLVRVENANTNGGNVSNTITSTAKIQFNDDDGLNLIATDNTAQIRLNQALKTTSNVTFNTVQHSGLVMTQGTNIDQYYELNINMQITDEWQDTPIKSTALPTGTYIVQVFANDNSVGGQHYNETYSGLMSWYSSDTDSTIFDEIVLHRAGRGPGSGVLFLRVQRTETSNSDDLKLQISGTIQTASSVLYTFKFRRML
ncbi:hypothetical protein EB118_06160 [bacterium]|nr:hypothetical protein [bacterium]